MSSRFVLGVRAEFTAAPGVVAALIAFSPGVPAAPAAPIFQLDCVSTQTISTENTGARCAIGFAFIDGPSEDIVELTLSNTTPATIGSSLTAVGLEWPDGIGVRPTFAAGGTSTFFDRLTYDVRTSPAWLSPPGGYDVMITSDGSFEGGSPQGAPKAGQTHVVRLSLGDTGLTATQLGQAFEAFYATMPAPHAIARFQAVGPEGNRSDKVIAPEPATLVMLALGSLTLFRRQRS